MNKLNILGLIFILISCDSKNEFSNQSITKIDSLMIELKNTNYEIDSLKIRLSESQNQNEVFANESFDNFFWNFMTDSTFQIKRVNFPLTYITWKDNIGGEIDTTKIKKNEWKHEWFYVKYANERTQIYDNYNLELRPTNERLIHWYGVETGGDVKYYFKGFDGKWHLIMKEQLGD